MPEVTPAGTPAPIAVIGWDGGTWRAFTVDALGHLNVNVLTNLGLDDALQSVATDRLIVRGEDQLFSLKGVLSDQVSVIIDGADGDAYSNPVPAGEVWIVTTVAVADSTTAPTRIRIGNAHDGVVCVLSDQVKAWAASEFATWSGHTFLDQGDRVRGRFYGGLVGDRCYVHTTGYIMTLEV